MPYFILLLGVFLGLYGLYRFFLKASLKQVRALLMTGAFIVICAALFFLAVTGRLPAALGLVVVLLPFALSFKKARGGKGGAGPYRRREGPLTRAEALEVLGLKEGATAEDIHDAYKKLMKKVHPDQEGSGWLAAKLNEAKDILTG